MLTKHPQTLKSVFRTALQPLQSSITVPSRLESLINIFLACDLIKRIAKLLCGKLLFQHIRIDGQIGQPLVSWLVVTVTHGADRKGSGVSRIS